MPPGVIVPVDIVPPGTPLTLQVTLVSVALVTWAERVCEFPSKTEPLVGVTVTVMDGGGGGGGGATDCGLPPPQPGSATPKVRTTRKGKTAGVHRPWFPGASILFAFNGFCVRGRMQGGMQAKGQRKEEPEFDSGGAVRSMDVFPNYMKQKCLRPNSKRWWKIVMALRESTRSALRLPISRFGTETGGTVPIREGPAATHCAIFDRPLCLTSRLNGKAKRSLDSMNQMTCCAVWQVYGEGERRRLA